MTTSEAPQPNPSTPQPPTDAVPAATSSAGSTPASPVDAVPADAVPADSSAASPVDAVPTDAVPAATSSADAAPVDTSPADAPSAEAPAPREEAADPRLLLARAQEPGSEPAVAAAPARPTVTAEPTPAPATEQAAAAPVAPTPVASTPSGPPAPLSMPGMAPTQAPAPEQSAAQPPVSGAPYPHPGAAHPYAGAVDPQAQAPTFWALPPQYAPKVRKERPWLRTVGRWATAVGVLAVVGSVTAALVAAPARTDLPGLRTPSDGRWTFPALTLPSLPPGTGQSGAGAQHVHRVDLRSLLLPAPAGAGAESGLPGTGGWYPTRGLLGLFTPQAALSVKAALQDAGLRHVAATGWTMPDGTHTEIYLQQFRSPSTASDVDTVESVSGYLAAAPDAGTAGAVDPGGLVAANVHAAPAADGHPAVMYGYMPVGDTELLVVMSNPKKVPAVDFEQVFLLENRLLTA